MPKTYIIGHQKPDTDATVATLAFKYIFESDNCWGHQESIPCITHNLNPETKYIFEKFQQETPKLITAKDINPEDKIVLVDHNEESQRLQDLNPDQITDIFDHHKVNLSLEKPIFITTKAWGSTCSVAYHIMKTHNITPPAKLATLMLCAILSDTVGFKSSTTTEKDRALGNELAQIAGIDDINQLTLEIFKAKSDISQLNDDQIVKNDYKIFELANKKVFIGQLETVEQETILLTKKAGLIKAMQKIKDQESVDLIYLVISDILKVNSKIIIIGESEQQVAEKAFSAQTQNNILDIGPKLSRKKEILPPIEEALRTPGVK